VRRLYQGLQAYNLGLGVVCLGLFVAALIDGQGWRSFAFLVAAVWWAALGIYWRRKQLRRKGTARARARDDRQDE
jgi:hypothetical protein